MRIKKKFIYLKGGRVRKIVAPIIEIKEGIQIIGIFKSNSNSFCTTITNMQKTALICILIIGLWPTVYAQESSIIDKVAKETCSCMEDNNLDNITKESFEQEIGTCLINVASKYTAELKEAMDFDINDQNSVSALGEKVGRNIALNCPTLFQKMMELYSDDREVSPDQVQQLARYRGTFVRMEESGAFAKIVLRGEGSAESSFTWMEYFPGSEMFLQGGNSLNGQMMTVTYKASKVYHPGTKEYREIKIITRVDNQ